MTNIKQPGLVPAERLAIDLFKDRISEPAQALLKQSPARATEFFNTIITLCNHAMAVYGADPNTIKPQILPIEPTPAIKSVLGLMCFQIGHYAHIYQAAGFDVEKKAEAEQAFILHRWLLYALEHGENWKDIAYDELSKLKEKAEKS